MKRKQIISFFLAVVLVFSFAACGKKEEKPGNKVTVSFNTDGGNSIAAQSIEKGSLAAKPETPKKEGYIFDKWVLGDTEYTFSEPVNENIVLKALWIDPNASGGSGGGTEPAPAPVPDVQVESLAWVNNWYWVQEYCQADPEIVIVPESARSKVEFYSSDTSIATIDSNGYVYGVKPGKVTLTVKCGDKSDTLPLEVRPTPGSKLALSTEHLVLDYNASAPFLPYSSDLKVTFGEYAPDDKTVTWSSSDPATVYVYDNGGIEGRKLGHAVITATDVFGRVGNCDVYVTGKIMYVNYNGSTIDGHIKLDKNATYQITIIQDEFFDYGLSKETYVSEICAIDADPCFQYQQYTDQPYGMLHITSGAVSGQSYLVGFVNSIDGIRVDLSITIK